MLKRTKTTNRKKNHTATDHNTDNSRMGVTLPSIEISFKTFFQKSKSTLNSLSLLSKVMCDKGKEKVRVRRICLRNTANS